MERLSFIFPVFFMLLGPIKLIPLFGGLTRGVDTRFKREVAIRGALIASVLCASVATAGRLSWAGFTFPLRRCVSQEDWS